MLPKYEQNAYEYLHKISPRVGASVKTPSGVGTVESVDLLKGDVKVSLEKDGGDDGRELQPVGKSRPLHGRPGRKSAEKEEKELPDDSE